MPIVIVIEGRLEPLVFQSKCAASCVENDGKLKGGATQSNLSMYCWLSGEGDNFVTHSSPLHRCVQRRGFSNSLSRATTLSTANDIQAVRHRQTGHK